MKKFVIFIVVVIAIVVTVGFMNIRYQNSQNEIRNENKFFEQYYQKESTGREIATLINRAMDNNNKNNIAKSETGKYENNENNSINIDFKMLDNDETYNMETISKGGIGTFTSYYGEILFKCTKIEYHKTGKVKYILFEQITK